MMCKWASMGTGRAAVLAAALLLFAEPAQALYEGLQCVPYARELTGVQIRGDAHTWWEQAAGRYERGSRPRVGAVMAFQPHGKMQLGHVAAVRRIIDSRRVLISHANWSTIDGIRGHIENDVLVVDASPDNDWSRVRVWYTPNEALGTTEWPLSGFIYPDGSQPERNWRMADADKAGRAPNRNLFGDSLEKELRRRATEEKSAKSAAWGHSAPDSARQAANMASDPIGDLIARTAGW